MTLAILRAANALNRCLSVGGDLGPLHLLVSDGNSDDSNLRSCREQIPMDEKNGWPYAALDRDCLDKFEMLSADDREQAVELAGDLWRATSRAY